MSEMVKATSTSVDGFIRAAGATPDEPLGKGGERLHHWAFNGTDEDRALLQAVPSPSRELEHGAPDTFSCP